VNLDLTHPAASGRGFDPRWEADLLVLAATDVERGPHPSSDGVGVLAARCHAAGTGRVLLSLLGPAPKGLLDRFYANWLDEKMSPNFALREAKLWWRRNAEEDERPFWAALVLYGLP
jgi:CHAT domain-containing protein